MITGAGRGLGRALLEEYLSRSWTVFPLLRDVGAAEALSSTATGCHPIVADVGSMEVEAAIAVTLGDLGIPLDLLINNAGNIKKLRWLAATEPQDVEQLFRVHCLGALRCTRAALPWLRQAECPVVVNITSRFGSIGRTAAGEFRGIYSYHIAKAAQNMLTVCLDRELRGEGIRVLAVHPGRLRTAVAAADADTDPADAARILADWLEHVDLDTPCALHDLMGGGQIEW
jgi:NAD(P)-dependent dehydrogenase (short-subunit alcohol dehydrogenase family)